ncbi:AraC family transcriptional regulator [Sphaerisporangium perillae]|uniref:AraC family transcriptional regulator n=1 Tax=Sphaerisporangium perillae TaxID=2935860 RepID=UPI00200F5596|nr:helix-turn-helix domain-containing protein [Sphaerisporangium perillae]
MVHGTPAAALRSLIGDYHGYRERDGLPGRHRGLPSPYLTVIVTLDDPLDIAAHPDPAQPPGRYHTLVGGLHTSTALITHEGRQAGVQLALSPLGARALLGLPAGPLRNVDVDATAVLGSVANELHDRLNAAPDWGRRFAILDELLLRQADLDRVVPAEVVRAWRLLLSSGGRMPVGDLAHEVGWSTRHLRARFTAEIGLTPKAAARVIRFDRARRKLQHLAGAGMSVPCLADLAAECGYYDQAHLAREFRDLAGCPPTQWLAEEFRNVQAPVPVLEPDSMA